MCLLCSPRHHHTQIQKKQQPLHDKHHDNKSEVSFIEAINHILFPVMAPLFLQNGKNHDFI